jgi:adenosine kinase
MSIGLDAVHENKQGVIFAMCNPLLDIVADVEQDFLEKYKLKSNDAILASKEHLPLYEELVSNYKVQYIAGGSAQNTMRAAQVN